MKRKLTVLFLLSSLLMLSVNQFVFASGAEQVAQLAIPLLVVNTSFLNVRSGDGPQYTVVLTVVGGTELPVLGREQQQDLVSGVNRCWPWMGRFAVYPSTR